VIAWSDPAGRSHVVPRAEVIDKTILYRSLGLDPDVEDNKIN
jgi:hypothetical protein